MGLTYDVTVTTDWVVLGPDDRVVVILSGQDAAEAADDWKSDRYRILPLTR